MKNPLVETVEHEMNQLGMTNAKLVRESYNAQSFGNAEAVYELRHLRFYFVRDRGQDILSLSSQTSPENYHPFCDVSLMMGWESLNEIINVVEPISLNKALGYIKNGLDQLDKAFSANEIMSTSFKIKAAERQRTKAMFR